MIAIRQRNIGVRSKLDVVKRNLVLHLDAGIADSYPGSGTTWYDISGNGNNFEIVAGAYSNNGNNSDYMDFNGSYGCAKNSSDISLSGNVTYCVVTRVLNSNSAWRTLTRSYTADHHVIIQSGGWNIGMFDNDSSGFNSTGFLQTSLPNHGTSDWIFLFWRYYTSSPYYTFGYNDSPEIIRGSITSTNAQYNRGFGSIGAYHGGNTTPSSASQYWGDIAAFAAYSTALTDDEILKNYAFYKSRYSLP